jgi:hypothetical protein
VCAKILTLTKHRAVEKWKRIGTIFQANLDAPEYKAETMQEAM